MWGLRRLVRRKRRRRVAKRTAKERALYIAHKEPARVLIEERVAYWSAIIGVLPGRITVRDQRSRWGSCSTRGNLNFNFRVVCLPLELVDYIVVHELCHLRAFNHSPEFWNHVATFLPDYVLRKHALKELQALSLGSIVSSYIPSLGIDTIPKTINA